MLIHTCVHFSLHRALPHNHIVFWVLLQFALGLAYKFHVSMVSIHYTVCICVLSLHDVHRFPIVLYTQIPHPLRSINHARGISKLFDLISTMYSVCIRRPCSSSYMYRSHVKKDSPTIPAFICFPLSSVSFFCSLSFFGGQTTYCQIYTHLWFWFSYCTPIS